MSKVDRLLADLCPEGVEFRALGDIARLVRGNGLPKSDFAETGVGCIHYGQIYTHYGVWAKETLSRVSEEKAKNLAKVNPGDLVITNTSENVEDVCKAVAWLGDSQIVTGGHATVIKPGDRLDPRFLSYWFCTSGFFAQKKRLAVGTKVIDVSAKSLATVSVPVPPLSVQQEIVQVLDTFTELEAELKAELKARRRQYQYYRDALLTFPERHDGDGASKQASKQAIVRQVAMSEVAFYVRSKVPCSGLDSDTYTGVDNLFPGAKGRGPSSHVPEDGVVIGYQKDDVLIGNIRPYLKKIWLADNDGGSSPDVLVIRVLSKCIDGILPRFLYYVLSSDRFFAYNMQHAKGAKMPRGDKAAIMAYSFTLPSLEEQARIVSILDKFDTLVNDLTSGLPAEIAARRQQYEYYRDRLLTFREKRGAA